MYVAKIKDYFQFFKGEHAKKSANGDIDRIVLMCVYFGETIMATITKTSPGKWKVQIRDGNRTIK